MKRPFIYCIGARCGSQSMLAALERFGYRVYSMPRVLPYYSHLNSWYDHARGYRAADIKALLGGCDAVTGQPCSYFPEDILAAYPDALVIINTREPAAWYHSYQTFFATLTKLRRFLWFSPRIRAIYRLMKTMVFDGFFSGRIDDKAFVMEKLESLHARAAKLVPPERILVFDVTEGWKPLCDFLKVPAPDEPFPHLNRNESIVKKRVILAVLKDLVWLGLAVIVVAVFGLSWISAAALAAEAGAWLLFYKLRRG